MIICSWNDISHYAPLLKGLDEAVATVNALTEYEDGKVYPLSDGNRVIICNGKTNPVALAEAHREYLDLQYIIKGSEYMGWADLSECKAESEFDTGKDMGWYSGDIRFVKITAGQCYVVFPEDVHMPCRHLEEPTDVVKAIIKLKV